VGVQYESDSIVVIGILLSEGGRTVNDFTASPPLWLAAAAIRLRRAWTEPNAIVVVLLQFSENNNDFTSETSGQIRC
jgi:hypothetical protein